MYSLLIILRRNKRLDGAMAVDERTATLWHCPPKLDISTTNMGDSKIYRKLFIQTLIRYNWCKNEQDQSPNVFGYHFFIFDRSVCVGLHE